MRKRKWYKYYSRIILGVLAACEILYAYLKHHTPPGAKPHWFVDFYDPIKDYRSAYLAILVFVASVPAFRYFKKYYELFTIKKTHDRTRVEMNAESQFDLKKIYIQQLLSHYKGLLRTFEENRRILDIRQPVQLKFRKFEDLHDFKNDRGRNTTDFIAENLMIDMFSAAVVGPSGIGKSYTILRRITDSLAAIDLRKRKAVMDAKLPFFFRLGNWKTLINADSSDHLELWMAEQLKEDYDIEIEHHISWLINNKQIVPVLDGLDEIPELDRDDCLTAISKCYRAGRPIIVSCRKAELLKLVENPALGFNDLKIVELLTLKREDIIREIGINISEREKIGLLAYLNTHDDLWEKINAPLILNLFQKTYTLLTPEEVTYFSDHSSDEFLGKLWEKYDSYIFLHKDISLFKALRLKIYAAWIARISPDSSFYLDKIQPSWLTEGAGPDHQLIGFCLQFIYFLTTRIIAAVIIAVAVGLIISEATAFIGVGVLAGLLLALIILFQKNDTTVKTSRQKIIDIVVISLLLMVCCGFFQGISVPRRLEDMSGIFSKTESFPGILLGLISGIVFGYRKNYQSYDFDIKPVEKFTFDWKHSWQRGLAGGAAIGLLIGCCGVVVELIGHSTFQSWLDNYTIRTFQFIDHLTGINFKGSVFAACIAVFILAWLVAFLVGFVIVAILSGRDETQIIEADARKKKKLNFGIYRSGIQSLKHGAITAFGLSFLYGLILFLFTHRYESITRAVEIGGGVGIIAFLWFGGLEVLQHCILRLYLFFYGILPLRMRPWLQCMHQVAFIQRTGNGLHFQHETLKQYLSSLIPAHGRLGQSPFAFIRYRRAILIPLVLLLLYVTGQTFFQPMQDRFFQPIYWKNGEQFQMLPKDQVYNRLTNNRIIVKQSGNLTIDAAGKIQVGTFVGTVHAEGTSEGFLGVPVGDTYNVIKPYQHGALLYKIVNRNRPWAYVVPPDHYFWPWSERVGQIAVQKGDIIAFCVNDNELQNDAYSFELGFSLSKR